MSFEISEASASDIDEIVNINHLSMQQDPIYTRIFRDVSDEDECRFMTNVFSKRFEVPNASTIFKVTDKTKGTMVAWAGLWLPYGMTTGEAAFMAQQPPNPEGMHLELGRIFFGPLSSGLAKDNGYDAETDFRRGGSRTLPAYQRLGLGTMLSRHCSDISDASNRRMFITARPAAVRMCEKTGFTVIATYSVDLSRYDGEGIDVTSLMLRDAQSSRGRE